MKTGIARTKICAGTIMRVIARVAKSEKRLLASCVKTRNLKPRMSSFVIALR